MAITILAPRPAPALIHARKSKSNIRRHARSSMSDSDPDSDSDVNGADDVDWDSGHGRYEYGHGETTRQSALDRELERGVDGGLGSAMDIDGDVVMGRGSGFDHEQDGRGKERERERKRRRRARKAVVTPGELITEDGKWMRGHGTTTTASTTTTITSTLLGTLTLTNRLLSIHPLPSLSSPYHPSIGDLTISRITSLTPKRYTTTLFTSPLLASLPLSSINLPGGILRRRTAVDELNVRGFFGEGDLVVAEVQSLSGGGGGTGKGAGAGGGAAVLHTRSLRYGKLRDGVGIFVGVGGVGRGGGRIVQLRNQNEDERSAAGLEVILAVNGFIWIAQGRATADGPSSTSNSSNPNADPETEQSAEAMYTTQNSYIPASTRLQIAQMACIVVSAARRRVGVDEGVVRRGWEVMGELLADDVEMGGEEDDKQERRGGGGGDMASLGERVVDVLLSERRGT